VSVDRHFSETLALSVLIGGGYGLKTARYHDLENQAEPLAPYAYRYLASGLVGVAWSPVYGKLTATGRSVVHYDVYGAARAGVTIEQSVIPVPAPSYGITGAPTVSLGIGARFFVKKGLAVRAELRDDLLAEYRELTTRWAFKQNAALTLGITGFLGKARR
jgi:outer membrane beta-barrel protein